MCTGTEAPSLVKDRHHSLIRPKRRTGVLSWFDSFIVFVLRLPLEACVLRHPTAEISPMVCRLYILSVVNYVFCHLTYSVPHLAGTSEAPPLSGPAGTPAARRHRASAKLRQAPLTSIRSKWARPRGRWAPAATAILITCLSLSSPTQLPLGEKKYTISAESHCDWTHRWKNKGGLRDQQHGQSIS